MADRNNQGYSGIYGKYVFSSASKSLDRMINVNFPGGMTIEFNNY